MGELARGERLQIMLSSAELAALDDWRFVKRMPSRASAVREILKRGLAAEGFATAKSGSRSKDYAVVDSAKAGSKKPARSMTDTPGPREAPQRLARAGRHRGDVSI
jgi:hypothetical protein